MRRPIRCVLMMLFLCAVPSACKEKTAGSTLSDYDAAIHKRIRKMVDDDEKRDKLELLHAQVRLRRMDLAMIYVEEGIKFRNAPDMSREDAALLLEETAEKRAKTLRDVSTVRLEMRTLLSEAEWNQLYEGSLSPFRPQVEE